MHHMTNSKVTKSPVCSPHYMPYLLKFSKCNSLLCFHGTSGCKNLGETIQNEMKPFTLTSETLHGKDWDILTINETWANWTGHKHLHKHLSHNCQIQAIQIFHGCKSFTLKCKGIVHAEMEGLKGHVWGVIMDVSWCVYTVLPIA